MDSLDVVDICFTEKGRVYRRLWPLLQYLWQTWTTGPNQSTWMGSVEELRAEEKDHLVEDPWLSSIHTAYHRRASARKRRAR